MLVKELFRLDDLYYRLERAMNGRQEVELKHDLVYVVNNGLLKPDDQNVALEKKRDELNTRATNLRLEIDTVVKTRTELILSELTVARRKLPTGAKAQNTRWWYRKGGRGGGLLWIGGYKLIFRLLFYRTGIMQRYR